MLRPGSSWSSGLFGREARSVLQPGLVEGQALSMAHRRYERETSLSWAGPQPSRGCRAGLPREEGARLDARAVPGLRYAKHGPVDGLGLLECSAGPLQLAFCLSRCKKLMFRVC